MSKPQGPQKPNLINILLIAAMVYLGYMVFTEPQRKAGQDKRTAPEILKELQEQNQKLLDVTIPQTAHAYRAKLGDLKKAENLSQEEVDRMEMHSIILQADTAYKSALYREKLGGESAHLAYGKLNRGLE